MDENGDTTEYLHLGSSLGLMAMHGGGIEPGTEEIARFVSINTGASLYVYAGRLPAGNLSLHRPSHSSKLEERFLVKRFLEHVSSAISLHGHGRDQKFAYVGGLHQSMGQRFVAIAQESLPKYEWISDPEMIPQGIGGLNPKNIVNLPPDQGMQLELPRGLRQTKLASDGKLLEPAGDALVLSRLLVRFVDTLKV